MSTRRHLTLALVIATAQSVSLSSSASAQTAFEVVTDFAGTTVAAPNAALVRGSDGTYYGTSTVGGGAGNVFRMTPDGTVTVLHAFGGSDGQYPHAALVEGADGALYGTTLAGGAGGNGAIFRITKEGDFTLLHSIAAFDATRGCYPEGFQLGAPLLEGDDGNLYGTISNGENCSGGSSYAFIFRIAPGGAFELLPKPPPGQGYGSFSGLTRGPGGAFYGTTYDAAGAGAGVLFRLTPSGTYTMLHAFSLTTEGFFSQGELVQGRDGLLYGTTVAGGTFFAGTAYKFDPAALVLTTLHAFGGGHEAGAASHAGLLEGGDGWFYGTTNGGTVTGGGAIFRIDGSTGVVETLHLFDGGNGGAGPGAEVIEPSPGVFLGTTAAGGPPSQGTVFRLTVAPPNLQVAAVRAPAATAPGAGITVGETTRNAGLGSAGATTTRLWLSSDKTLGEGDVPLGARSVPGLEAGARHAGSTDVTLPAVAPGRYFLLAQADADGNALEGDEADNVKAKALVLGADLRVTAMAFAPTSPVSAEPTAITLALENAGGETAGPTITRIYVSANGRLDGSDTLVAEMPLGPLGPGASASQPASVTLPAGTYYVLAICDALDAVVEARETNNVRKVRLTVP